jgi:predicted Zn-dependent peptidase
VAPGNVKESIREAKQVLQHVQQNGVTEKECGIAKAAVCSRLLAGLQGSAGTADLLAEIAVKELPADYFQHYIRSIKALKRKTINEIAGTYIDWNKINIVTAGPASDK